MKNGAIMAQQSADYKPIAIIKLIIMKEVFKNEKVKRK